jgi:hypothetical protein
LPYFAILISDLGQDFLMPFSIRAAAFATLCAGTGALACGVYLLDRNDPQATGHGAWVVSDAETHAQRIDSVDALNNLEGLLPLNAPVHLELIRNGQKLSARTLRAWSRGWHAADSRGICKYGKKNIRPAG